MGRRAGGRRLVRLRDAAGHRLISPRHNFTAMAVAVLGERDPDIMRLLRRWVTAGDTVFDVGANIGTYTLPLARLVGSAGRVVAFEPNRPTRACLRANVRAAGFLQVAVIAAAAGPEVGRVSLVSPNDNPGEVHVSREAGGGAGGGVVMTTLDETAARLRVAEARYVKLDIEGFELEALRGAERLLRESPRLLVQTEVVPSHAARFGYDWAQLRDFFAKRGYRPHRCTREGELVAQAEFAEEVGDWFWARAEIGRASCRERVYTSV
jgi:FkbM family methyltransferase